MIILRKNTKNNLKKTIGIMLVLTVIIALMYYVYKMYKNIEIMPGYATERTNLSTKYEQTVEKVEEKSITIADMIEEVSQSVCGISKLSSAGGSILSTASETELGLGTGIIVSSDGYILSNKHVTGDKFSTCYVKIEDRNTYTGIVVWADEDLDLSITKISAKNLKPAKVGDTKDIRVGESVYAIGNPVGYEFRRTVTSGIISAINRTVKIEENEKMVYMSDLIQTDATINPGNSGGPLIYPNGEVIGVNSVKITSAEGIGFAIPIDVVEPVINSFVETGNFEEATLGLYVYDEQVAKYLKLNSEFSKGIYIAKINTDGPVFGKGLKEGDIITKIDNIELNTINNLKKYIYSKKPGDEIDLSVSNGKVTKTIKIELSKK